MDGTAAASRSLGLLEHRDHICQLLCLFGLSAAAALYSPNAARAASLGLSRPSGWGSGEEQGLT